jgi:hypothetical protein
MELKEWVKLRVGTTELSRTISAIKRALKIGRSKKLFNCKRIWNFPVNNVAQTVFYSIGLNTNVWAA